MSMKLNQSMRWTTLKGCNLPPRFQTASPVHTLPPKRETQPTTIQPSMKGPICAQIKSNRQAASPVRTLPPMRGPNLPPFSHQ
eukprot:1157698-Pelagomonas_calceolata.AAC.2